MARDHEEVLDVLTQALMETIHRTHPKSVLREHLQEVRDNMEVDGYTPKENWESEFMRVLWGTAWARASSTL